MLVKKIKCAFRDATKKVVQCKDKTQSKRKQKRTRNAHNIAENWPIFTIHKPQYWQQRSRTHVKGSLASS